MLRVGVPMTLAIVLIWGIMVAVAARISRKIKYVGVLLG